MSLIQFLRILYARRWLILLPALACLVVATAVAFMLPKRYPASAKVILDIVKPDPVTGETIGSRDARSYVNTQIQLIQDMRVAGLVVDRLGLVNDPQLRADYEASGGSADDGGMRSWLGQQIINNTTAGLVKGSNILEIDYEAATPEQAKQIVTALRDAYVESSLRYKVDSASSTGSWFGDQAQKAQQQLQVSERTLAKYMDENNIVLVGGVDSDTAKLQALSAAVQAAQGNQTTTEANASTRLANDPVVDQLRMQLAAVEDQLALAATRLGTNHPDYKSIQARKRTLETQIAQAQANTRKGVSAVSGAATASLSQLQGQLDAQEKVVLQRKPVIDELTRLTRDVELKRGLYERAMARTEDLKMQADISQTGLVVLGDPVAQTTPSYPKIPLIIALAGLAGLALGTLSALVVEFVGRRIRGEEDLAYASGAPVLVTVRERRPSQLRQRIRRFLTRKRDHPSTGELQAI